MVKLNGFFQFVASESESDCAIFFIGDVDEIVSLTITELNMRDSCNQQDEYVKVSLYGGYRAFMRYFFIILISKFLLWDE